MNVYVEEGSKKVFACVIDWPGWCRSAKTEDFALESLARYRSRYETVVAAAGLSLPKSTKFHVDARVAGDATTDFGAPSARTEYDHRRLTAKQGARIAAIVRAAWSVFDAVAARSPAELRKGPRGGGRDRDKMIDHVLGAESSYLRTVGLRFPAPDRDDMKAIEEMRQAFRDLLARPSDGQPPGGKGWPVRYAARRIAWHVLDHAWEMEDRS